MIGIALFAAAASCSPVGDWNGELTVSPGITMRLVLHLKERGSTLDSPDQNASAIPADLDTTAGDVKVTIPSLGAEFDGAISNDCQTLLGLFRQGSATLKVQFERRTKETALPARPRPQTPKPPFPYRSRDVALTNGEVTLAATMTMPVGPGPFPALVLIAGSGPQDRDETVAGHRIFLVLADRLTREGFAVLRYDKRGVGRSTGNYAIATQRDFIADAAVAMNWLRKQIGIASDRVGLLGHSEGAEIAPAIANADGHVRFVVLLSAPAETGLETIASQAHAIALAKGVPAETVTANDALERQLLAAVASAPDGAAAEAAAAGILNHAGMPPEHADIQAKSLSTPWYRSFLIDDPLPGLRALTVPTLVIAGSKDLQVLPARNLPLIRDALAGKEGTEIVELPGLNHLLQPATTGLPTEYGEIATTVDPKALNLISEWLKRSTR